MRSELLEQVVRDCVQDIGDPLFVHILRRCEAACPWTNVEEVKAVVRGMVNRGVLHMREDPVDHDWTYRKGPKWT